MSGAFERFEELEKGIAEAINLIKAMRLEKSVLEKDLTQARREIHQLEGELDKLRREREAVKNKVESLLESLAEITAGSLA